MNLVFSKDFVFCINFATSFHRLYRSSSACIHDEKCEDKTKWHQIHHFIDIGARISHTRTSCNEYAEQFQWKWYVLGASCTTHHILPASLSSTPTPTPTILHSLALCMWRGRVQLKAAYAGFIHIHKISGGAFRKLFANCEWENIVSAVNGKQNLHTAHRP